MTSAALTTPETSALVDCEAVIERGLATFIEVGNALMRIRDERLYRIEFGTFQEYCEVRWDMDRRRANQLIAASEIAENLGTMVPKPESERVVRPLTVLPPPQQREAWQAAVESAPDHKPTAKHVAAAVAKVLPPPQKQISEEAIAGAKLLSSFEPAPEDDDGDTPEEMWHRGLLFRAQSALGLAAFEDWSHFTVTSQLVEAASQAAAAWKDVAAYLKKLNHEQKHTHRAA